MHLWTWMRLYELEPESVLWVDWRIAYQGLYDVFGVYWKIMCKGWNSVLSTCLHPSSLLHSRSSSFRHATLRLLAVRLLSHPARLQTRRYYYNKGLRPDELTPSFLAALPLVCLGFVSRAVTLQRKIGDCSPHTQRTAVKQTRIHPIKNKNP